MTRHPGIVIRALTWNLYHGRDHPPKDSDAHVEVNRPLREEFAAKLAGDPWTVALLQEAPPRWLRGLCRTAKAHGASALTSRNFGAALRAVAAELNPDLIASNEGGSNQVLVRPPWRIEEVRRLTLTFFPERRRLVWTRLHGPDGRSLAVGNLHATANDVGVATRDLELAAERSVAWADGAPLIFGGDFNVRPTSEPEAYAMLEERFGLAPPTGPRVLDHLLVRGLDVLEPPEQLPPSWRDWREPDGRLVRLSDHEAVAAVLGMG